MDNTRMNDSINHTSYITPDDDTEITVGELLLATFALILSALIIFVNIITIFLIKKTPNLHTLSNIYVASLATTDLVVGMCLIPLSLFYIPAIRKEYYNKNIKLCVLILGVNLGMAVVSTIHMSLIAIDRYMYILWPYIYMKIMNRRVIYIIILCAWSFGIFYALLPQLIHNESSEVKKCDITLAMPIEYLFYTTVSIYVVCVTIDVSMYTHILYTAYKQRRVIQSKTISPYRVTVAVTNTSQHETDKRTKLTIRSMFDQTTGEQHDIEELSEIDRQQVNNSTRSGVNNSTRTRVNNSTGPDRKQSSRMKSVKFFMTVFGVHFICLTPTVVCIGIDYHRTVVRLLYNMFNLLALLNSGMNFIIYYVLNARFRIAVLKLFRYRGVVASMEITDGSYLDG